MKIRRGTQQGAGRPFLPILGTKHPSHLNLTCQTVYLAFALLLTLELEGQHILPLELVDSLAWGAWLATVLVPQRYISDSRRISSILSGVKITR